MADYLELFDKSSNFLTSLLDKGQDAFWVASEDYSVQIYISPAFELIWGYDSKLLYENPLFWLETILQEDKAYLASIGCLPHSRVLSVYQQKYRIIRKDGEIRWIQDYTYPIFNQVGVCVGFAGIAKDITHLLEMENELQIANQFLPKLAEKMERSVFWVIDPKQEKQLYISKGFEKIWGRPTSFLYEDPAKWLDTLVSEDRNENPGSLVFMTSNGVEVSDSAYRIQRPDGDIRYIHDISFPIYHDKTKELLGFAGIAEDVTEAKLYELELKEAKEKAEAANIAKSNFIASISHDFRTPLNGLLGMAEILRSGRLYPEQKEYIEAILQAGNSLLDLVEDIINFIALDLNKLPPIEEWFNLEKVVEELFLTISPQAHEKKVELILNYSEATPKEIYGDISRIRRILMNLINNAVKFTNKGHVLISVDLLKESPKKVWLQFMVEDTGIGISPENFEYIFGSFNRIDPSYRGRYKGTGLGLTIVKQFVEDMGGKIGLNSKLNQGSIFYCNIPFKRVAKNDIVKPSDHYTGMRTLVVDDFRKRAITFIKQFGFQNADVASHRTVIETVKEAAKTNEPYQLILIDDELKCDLEELAKQLQAIYKSILILIADKDSKKTFQKMKRYGYVDSITKPVQSSVVINILESATILYTAKFKSGKRSRIKGRSILLIEDDELTQKITKWMLEELRCKVDIAGTGQQALAMLDNSYDLIITDVGLPDMDGIQLVETIRSLKHNNQKTPIVALTAHVLEKDKEKCIQAGMNDFLKKPLFKKDLKELLLKIFG